MVGIAQMAERAVVGRDVTGSIPVTHPHGRLLKWSTRAVCKTVGFGLRWFKSITCHHVPIAQGRERAAPDREAGGSMPSRDAEVVHQVCSGEPIRARRSPRRSARRTGCGRFAG
jgi:hypothetical protein